MNKYILNKGNADADVKKEIRNLLTILQEGYVKRDVKAIDSFMEKLFDKNKDIVILGTSNDEWFLNYDEAKELFTSDWEWWGDVMFNIDDTIISTEGNMAWLTTSGTVKYEYENSEARYERLFKNLSEGFFGEKINTSYTTLKESFYDLNWLLHHLLNDWGKEKRTYLSPIRFSAVLENGEDRWVFRQIQFSFPTPLYPDLRVEQRNSKINQLGETWEKLKEYKYFKTAEESKAIKQVVSEFQTDYFDLGIDELIERYTVSRVDARILNEKSIQAADRKELADIIKKDRENWQAISIDTDEALLFQNNNVAWLITGGNIQAHLSEEAAIRNQVDKIREMFKKDLTDKEKLFEMRKHISMTLREIAKGEDYIWPIRFEGVLIKELGKWKFAYYQISFPFYFILEGLRDEMEIE